MLAISFNYESHRLCVIRTLMCVGVKGQSRHENREMQVKMSSFIEATIVLMLQDVWMLRRNVRSKPTRSSLWPVLLFNELAPPAIENRLCLDVPFFLTLWQL